MTVTKSVINDGEIVDYTKSHIPYMDTRFSCSLVEGEQGAPVLKKVQAKKEKPATEHVQTFWIEPKAAEPKLVFKNEVATVSQTLSVDKYFSSPEPVYNVQSFLPVLNQESKAACDPCTNDPGCNQHASETDEGTPGLASKAIQDALIRRKEVLNSLDEKTSEIKATIKTIDWVISLYSDNP